MIIRFGHRNGGFVWPRSQASLGSPALPLPWEGHERPSIIEEHLDQDHEYLRSEFLKDQEPTVQEPSASFTRNLGLEVMPDIVEVNAMAQARPR